MIWLCVQRAQYLPEGGNLREVNFDDLDTRFDKALKFAEQGRRLERDEGARALWEQEYRNLTADQPGLLGALLGRAEAKVMRLALIYALLDLSPAIGVPHLTAALALWNYSVASARHIFGDTLGDPVADSILSALRAVYPKGLSRTEINNTLGRNVALPKVNIALKTLLKSHLARFRREKTSSTGRPPELWFAIHPMRDA